MEPQEPLEPQVPPEPQEPQAPQGPEIDPDLAFNIVSERLGYDPREARFEFEDIKRQREELQRQQRELERERQTAQSRYQPQPEFTTPGEKALFDIVNEMREERRQEREERRQREELEQTVEQQTSALVQAYQAMAQTGAMKPEDVEAKQTEFFQTMGRLYPDGVPASLGVYGAVQNTFRFWNNSRNGTPGPIQSGYRPRPSQREIVIPTGTVQTGLSDDQNPRRRPGETLETWVMRLRKMDEESGAPPPRLSDGQRVTIE